MAKWQRAEDHKDIPAIIEMFYRGYSVAAIMDRYGLTHPDQVQTYIKRHPELRPKRFDIDKQSLSILPNRKEGFREYMQHGRRGFFDD